MVPFPESLTDLKVLYAEVSEIQPQHRSVPALLGPQLVLDEGLKETLKRMGVFIYIHSTLA